MRIQNNLQQLSSANWLQKTGQQQGAKAATNLSNQGPDTGLQLADANRMSEESKARFMQKQKVAGQKIENTNVSTVGFAAQTQTKAISNAQNQDATTDTIDFADEVRQLEENLKSIAARVAIDTKKEYSAGATVNSRTFTSTGGVDFSQGDANSTSQVGSVESQTKATANTQNQGGTTDSTESQRNQASQRLGALLNRLGSTTQKAQDADVTSTTAKFAEAYSKEWANRSSTVSDVSAQEQLDEMTKLYQQMQANGQSQQAGVSALTQANQTTSQVVGLFRG